MEEKKKKKNTKLQQCAESQSTSQVIHAEFEGEEIEDGLAIEKSACKKKARQVTQTCEVSDNLPTAAAAQLLR